MKVEDAKNFIDDLNNDYFKVINGLYSDKISDDEHYLNLDRYLSKHAIYFFLYLSNTLVIRFLEEEKDWLEKRLSRVFVHKCFFIEHRKNIKWGKEVYVDNDTAFFCYMGGTTHSTKNNYSDIKVLGIEDEILKMVTTISFDYDTFHKTGKVSWKNEKDSSLIENQSIVLDNGWGEVVDLIKIEPPIGFQPFMNHYGSIL